MTRCTVHETRRTVVLMDCKMQIRHLQATCHLRPYQSEALTAVRDAYLAGKRRVIVSLPTGTGSQDEETITRARTPGGTAVASAR
jgi:superfamily II DNA or RNA helicase